MDERRPVLPLTGDGLTVRRGARTLLDDASIRIAGSGADVILGPNGAGKSLLLRVLAGLLAPDSGTVAWAGTPPDRRRAVRLGLVFQRPVLFRRSVLGNMRYALAAAGVPRADREDRARAALERAALSALAHAPARVLSGGEQQRLAVARALAADPPVLLLDEPTAALDPSATAAIESLIAEAAARGTKVVLVTQDIGQARRIADRVVFLNRGRILEQTPAGAFFDSPATQAAAAFVAGRLLLPQEEGR
jgi:tungstate transport system ATP-binding protein